LGDGMKILSVITGDPIEESDGVHQSGDKISVDCKDNYMNNVAKAKTAFTCTCRSDGAECSWTPGAAGFNCISYETAPMPVWQGAIYNFVKAVRPSYLTIKSRVMNLVDVADWGFDRFPHETYPELLDLDYWENANFTMFLWCPFDNRLGGYTAGTGKAHFQDFYPSESSPDGRMWSFLNRPGVALYRPSPHEDDENVIVNKAMYFKGSIDRSSNVDRQGPVDFSDATNFCRGSGCPFTCETGVLPGHHPNAIALMAQHYPVFAAGNWHKITEYFRNGIPKSWPGNWHLSN